MPPVFKFHAFHVISLKLFYISRKRAKIFHLFVKEKMLSWANILKFILTAIFKPDITDLFYIDNDSIILTEIRKLGTSTFGLLVSQQFLHTIYLILLRERPQGSRPYRGHALGCGQEPPGWPLTPKCLPQ
jgi:hypothetical protein